MVIAPCFKRVESQEALPRIAALQSHDERTTGESTGRGKNFAAVAMAVTPGNHVGLPLSTTVHTMLQRAAMQAGRLVSYGVIAANPGVKVSFSRNHRRGETDNLTK